MIESTELKFFKSMIIQLLKDSNVTVVQAMIKTLSQTFDKIPHSTEDQKQTNFSPFIGPLTELSTSLQSWRDQEIFLQQVQDFHKFFPSAVILSTFIPMLLKFMEKVRFFQFRHNRIGSESSQTGCFVGSLPFTQAWSSQ